MTSKTVICLLLACSLLPAAAFAQSGESDLDIFGYFQASLYKEQDILTGEGQPPESVETQAAILEMVASTPGAIGYVDHKLVTEQVITLKLIPIGND